MSVVLIIIGLIVGGVLGGRALLQNAKRNQLISEILSYEQAFNAFQIKYNALPGDLENAYDYWGISASCTNSRSTGGCNGDGSGQVDSSSPEHINVWMHLSQAELVQGSYDVFDNSPALDLGRTVPELKSYKGVAVNLFYSVETVFIQNSGHQMQMAGLPSAGGSNNRGHFLRHMKP